MRRRGRGAALLAALALCAGCEREPAFVSPVGFDTASVWVTDGPDSIPLLAEVAGTETQRAYGLMARPALDPGSGMLFLFDSVQAGDRGFWMFRTRMPLDIAFLDASGSIVSILTMEPCESDLHAEACPKYAPGVPYRAALEVNRGWFAEHGVEEGARIVREGVEGGNVGEGVEGVQP